MKKFILNTGIIATSCASILGVISCTDSDTNTPGGVGANGALLKTDANIKEAYVVIPEKSLFINYKQDDDKLLYSVSGNDAALNAELLEKISTSVSGVSQVFDTLNLKLKGKERANDSEKTFFLEISSTNSLSAAQVKSAIEAAWTASSKTEASTITAKNAAFLASGFSKGDPPSFSSNITVPAGNNIINTQLAVVKDGVFSKFLGVQKTKKVGQNDINIETTAKTSIISGSNNVPKFARRLLWANFDALGEDHFSIVMSIATVLAKKQSNTVKDYTDAEVIEYHEAFVKAANASFSAGIYNDDLDSTTLLEELKKIDSDVAEFLQEGELLVKTDV